MIDKTLTQELAELDALDDPTIQQRFRALEVQLKIEDLFMEQRKDALANMANGLEQLRNHIARLERLHVSTREAKPRKV